MNQTQQNVISGSPLKRKRLENVHAPAQDVTPKWHDFQPRELIRDCSLDEAIECIDEHELRLIVYKLATDPQNPNIELQMLVQQRYRAQILDSTQNIDFTHYAKEVLHGLKKANTFGSDWDRYGSTYELCRFCEEAIDEILSKVVPSSSFGTKKSALETLCSIGTTIAWTHDTFARNLHRDLRENNRLKYALIGILDGMSSLHKERMRHEDNQDGKGTFETKLASMIKSLRGDVIFDGLTSVLHNLRGDGGSEEDPTDQEVFDESGDDEDESGDDFVEGGEDSQDDYSNHDNDDGS